MQFSHQRPTFPVNRHSTYRRYNTIYHVIFSNSNHSLKATSSFIVTIHEFSMYDGKFSICTVDLFIILIFQLGFFSNYYYFFFQCKWTITLKIFSWENWWLKRGEKFVRVEAINDGKHHKIKHLLISIFVVVLRSKSKVMLHNEITIIWLTNLFSFSFQVKSIVTFHTNTYKHTKKIIYIKIIIYHSCKWCT